MQRLNKSRCFLVLVRRKAFMRERVTSFVFCLTVYKIAAPLFFGCTCSCTTIAFFIKQGLIFASKKVGGQSVSFVFSGEKLFFCFLLQRFQLYFPGKDFFKTKFRLHLEEGVRDDDDRKCQLSYFLRDQNLPRHPNPKCPNRR